MAREEHDREDLLGEATALVERVELLVDHVTVVAGFRRDGAASFFFGAEPVYQFNARGELRRAFDGGRIIKADRGQLAALTRERSDTEVALVRHDLSDEETVAFVAAMMLRLARLREVLSTNTFTLVGQVPADGEVNGRVADWLSSLPERVVVASAPGVS